MFLLIATIVLALNGQFAAEQRMPNNAKFDTMEACVAFKDGEVGQMAVSRLKERLDMAVKEGVTYTISVGCEPAGDDGSI